MNTQHSQTYGAELNAAELRRLLEHLMSVDLASEAGGGRKFPLCLWGRHGIGKTEIVRSYARERGWPLVEIAPAQFEEMGDLLGMPQVEETGGRLVTVLRPPAWAPVQEGPGILLLDDFNRADDRILRGLMPLLLDYRLASWALPPRWQIVLTANPESADYSVTPLDEAMLTRMRHATLIFELRSWARWAEAAGVDSRGIDFVLLFPELISGRRTTPRSLVQFFQTIEGIEDLEAALPLVQALAEASLDPATAAGFTSFIRQQLHRLPGPAAILNAASFELEILPGLEKLVRGPVFRMDILSALCSRLLFFLQQSGKSIGERQKANLLAFLRMDLLPAELRLAFAQDLAAGPAGRLQEILADPELGRLLLG